VDQIQARQSKECVYILKIYPEMSASSPHWHL